MNDLDRQLIALLRENARMPVVALAKKLRVARATVQNRIARLEQEGVIVGYTLRLKPEEEVHQIRAIMSLAVESNREEAVMRQLRGHVSVVTLHSVNGRWDLVAELRLDTLEAFDRSIDVHVGKIRQAIEADPRQPVRLLTVRGVGYVFARPRNGSA